MTPIQCDRWHDQLKACMDGELPLRTRLAVRLHLLRCGTCRQEIQEMTDISNSLKTTDAGTLDDALRTRILNAMPDTAPEVPDNLPLLRRPISRKHLPLYAFGASAVALVGWFVLYPVLPSTKEKERQLAAVSNLKQMGTASAIYGQDYDQKKISMGDQAASAGTALPLSPPPVAPAEQSYKMESPRRLYVQAERQKDISGAAMKAKAAPALPAPKMADSAAVAPEDTERQVHREASITLEVDNTEAKSETITTMTKTAGGYVANDELHTEDDGTKTASLTLKVPVAQFEAFLGQLAHLGDVKAKALSGEDITEKTSDQEQTVRVVGDDVKELEEKVQRARHASRHDEETLRELRIREAQSKAHLKILHTLAALADITVELHEKPKPQPVKPQTGGFLDDLNDTAHSAIAAFSQAARLPIVLLIWGVVYLPLFLALYVAYRVAARFWIRPTS